MSESHLMVAESLAGRVPGSAVSKYGWLVAWVVGALSILGGCKINEQDIEYWKGTQKGPGKIVAVILADKYGLELRTRAALALVEMEPRPEKLPSPAVEPVRELQVALQRIEDGATRDQIVDGLGPGLRGLLSTVPAAGETGPAKLQVRAKDAAFVLASSSWGSPATRASLTEAVMAWYKADFYGRDTAGIHTVEQVIRGLGPAAAGQLVDAIDAKLASDGLIKVAQLINQVGDGPAKQAAADKLIAVEREMEGAPFLDWLKQRVRTQTVGMNPAPTEARITAVAEANRAEFINLGALPAMKQLAAQPTVAARLLEIASSSDASPALVVRRTEALKALEGNATRAHLQPLLKLALDAATPTSVKDYAFDRVGDIRSPEAIGPMWPLVQSGSDQRLRWRAGALILQIGGPTILTEFFSKLPEPGADGYAPEELAQYATVAAQMNPAPIEFMRNLLNSPKWWDRVTALKYLERKGTSADLALMERLKGDAAALVGPARPRAGWPDGHTVGKVAGEAVETARQRLGQGQAQGGAANPGTGAPG